MTVACDTNIYLYVLDKDEPAKRHLALQLLRDLRVGNEPCVLLWQVAAELLAQMRSWRNQGRLAPMAPRGFLSHALKVYPLAIPSANVFEIALDLGDRYSLSHWDSMIVAACVDRGIDRLYTEDMGAPRRIDSVDLINPFLPQP